MLTTLRRPMVLIPIVLVGIAVITLGMLAFHRGDLLAAADTLAAPVT